MLQREVGDATKDFVQRGARLLHVAEFRSRSGVIVRRFWLSNPDE